MSFSLMIPEIIDLLHGFSFLGDAPKGSDLNNYSWIIISAMGGFILTLGGVIAKLYKDLQKCQEDRKRFTEDQLGLLRTLRNEFDKKS